VCALSLPEKKQNVVFALTLHGGHLGFFEAAVLSPQLLTWMDKVIVGYANAMCQWDKQKPPCQKSATSSPPQAEGGCAEEKA
jgi:abhydrolase domain-containing protein 2